MTLRGLLVASFLTLCAAAQSTTSQCNDVTYSCALHQSQVQLNVIPLANPLPDFGGLVGAGKCNTIQPYNVTVCRCTDVLTNLDNTRYLSYEVSATGGDTVYAFNANQTLLSVNLMGTGQAGNIGVDPATGKCTVMNPDSITPAGTQFDLLDPNIDYYQSGMTAIVKRVSDWKNPLQAPSHTTLFDYAVVCPQLATLGKVNWNSQILSNDGDTFAMAFGVDKQTQDTAQYAVVYQISADACWLFNSQTGHVLRAGAGCNGVVDMGIVSTFFPFGIHSMNMAPSGQLMIGANNCPTCPKHGPFIWYPRTTKSDLITAMPVGGHAVSGFKNWINTQNAPAMTKREFSNLSVMTPISSAIGVRYPQPTNVHMQWMQGDLQDTYPLCMAESSTAASPVAIQAPLQQEVFCLDMATNAWIRLAPLWNSGVPMTIPSTNFRTASGIIVGGSKGIIAYATDMRGGFGNIDGKTPTCIPGQMGANQCRSDVMIIIPPKTPPPPAATTAPSH